MGFILGADTPQEVGVRSGRASTGSVAAGATADVVVSFASAMPALTYTAIASVEEAGAGDNFRVLKIVSRALGSVTVRVINPSAAALTATVHVVAIPDA